MLQPGRDDDEIALRHVLLRPRDDRLPGAADEGEDLVGVLVHLLADLAARRDGHDDELGVLAGPQHATEVGALLGLGRDRVVDDGRHDGAPLVGATAVRRCRSRGAARPVGGRRSSCPATGRASRRGSPGRGSRAEIVASIGVRFPNRSCYGPRVGSTIKPTIGVVVVALAASVTTDVQRRTLLAVSASTLLVLATFVTPLATGRPHRGDARDRGRRPGLAAQRDERRAGGGAARRR